MASEWRETPYGLMSSELSVGQLSDLTVPNVGVQTGPFGSQLHQEDYVAEGTPIITVEHMGENRILHENLPRVSDIDKDRLSKYHLQTGDIVFSRVGSVDRRALVREAEDGWLFSGRCLRVRANPDVLDSTYLSYFFGLEGFKNYIRGVAVGATMPSINTQILSELPIFYPTLPVQRQVASILSAFDDKIELNRQMNRTLEQMARALFKSWFVDFDPVRAKMRGEQPEGMDAATAALFPSELVEVDGREVPKGWEWGTVGDIITFNPTLKLTKGQEATYLDMGNMPISEMSANGWITRPFGSGSKFQNGDTLLARITPCLENGKTAYVDFLDIEEIGWGSTEYIVMRPKPSIPRILPYILARNDAFRAYAISNMNGSSGRQRVGHQSLTEYPFPLAGKAIFQVFEEITAPIVKQSQISRDESARLAQLRDALLPRLLSGEIDVSEWETAD